MSGSADFLNAASLRAATFLRHVELHERLPSTNDRAIQLAADSSLELPALVAARLQTAGRGRGTNTWWSAEGALTFSLILDTANWGIMQCDWPKLSLTTAVAVCDAIAAEVPSAPVAIKWPNDVLIDGRKVCGILIESPGGATQAKNRLVVGVGINVNNSQRELPANRDSVGIAICDVSGHRHELHTMLRRFLVEYQTRLEQLAVSDPALFASWRNRFWLTDKDIDVAVDGRSIKGRCAGVADDGLLLVRTVRQLERLHSGTVRVLPVGPHAV